MLLAQLRKTPIIQIACKNAGIARSTYYEWYKKDLVFRKEADKAMNEGIQLVNDLAESKVIAGIKDDNVTLTIFWLKNHHDTYRDKLQLSSTKPKEEALSKEEQKLVERALALINKSTNPKKR